MGNLQDLKVLIVDDSITVRELMKQQLIEKGISQLEVAKNGVEAVSQFNHFKPHLVFLDINMPEQNGVEALRQILNLDKTAYVIMLSSLGTKEKVNETLTLGAKSFLMKPVENEHLDRIIKEVCELN